MMYFVYIMTNYTNTVLYTGVTNNLQRRVAEHASGKAESFTKRYKVKKLIYAEEFNDINTAILREKQIKNMSREKKEKLIEMVNPSWESILPF